MEYLSHSYLQELCTRKVYHCPLIDSHAGLQDREILAFCLACLPTGREDLDVTVEEGISRLARITSNVIVVGEKRLVTVPRPDKACKELLKQVNITLPGVLRYRETHVARERN